MDMINNIFGFILAIAVAYSLKTVPQLISEHRGIRKTPEKQGYGQPPINDIWTHGTELWIFFLYIIIGIPILIFIVEQSMKLTGTFIPATILILAIVLITRHYANKKAAENQAIIEAMPDEERYRNPEDKDKIYLW
ncbi:MAG: hypothetical protein E7Z86_05275 [Methanosphaera stadtmanae]|jgi:hypothetical protein|nr:hypothetical protein [Methanosphaera stadtmanae]